MKEFLEIAIVPISGLITYVLGHIAGRKKERAQTDTVELANLKEVVGFYKATFDDLKSQINTLTERLKEIEVENIKLKNNLHELNRQLKKQNG